MNKKNLTKDHLHKRKLLQKAKSFIELKQTNSFTFDPKRTTTTKIKCNRFQQTPTPQALDLNQPS